MNALEILGAVTPAAGEKAQKSLEKATQPGPMSKAALEAHAYELGAVAVGGAAGAYAWKKHRVLGFLLGSEIADAAYRAKENKDYKAAAADVGVVGAGVYAALHYKKHPVVAYCLGALAAGVVSSFVPGSRTSNARKGIYA